MLRSGLCYYCYTYIVVKLRISVRGTNDANRINKKLDFKNNAPFRSCISKINNTHKGNSIAMPMYNLLEYSSNSSMTSASFRNYYRDKVNDSSNENNETNNCRINNDKIATSNSFEYRTKIIGRTPDDNNILNPEVFVLLKYLSSIRKSLDLPLINYEIELDLRWTKNCIISEISRTATIVGNQNANPSVLEVVATKTTSTTFQINNAKLYVPVVTLSINANVKFLENLKLGFKRTIFWNKHSS